MCTGCMPYDARDAMNNTFDFGDKGMCINDIVYLRPAEAGYFIERGALLVDLREEEYKNGREFAVANTVWMPYHLFKTDFSTLPNDRLLILADYVGLHSKEAVLLLKAHGYTQLASLNGGVVAWVEGGFPTTLNKDDELIGSCACQLKPRKRKK